jgi:hypothetical protein
MHVLPLPTTTIAATRQQAQSPHSFAFASPSSSPHWPAIPFFPTPDTYSRRHLIHPASSSSWSPTDCLSPVPVPVLTPPLVLAPPLVLSSAPTATFAERTERVDEQQRLPKTINTPHQTNFAAATSFLLVRRHRSNAKPDGTKGRIRQ